MAASVNRRHARTRVAYIGGVPSDSALIATIAVGIGAAFLLGALATKLRIPAVVGYLLAGIALGPFTPGIVANTSLATQLADLGVILLMFGVGLQLSFRDLMAVRQVVLPGAPMQVTLTGGAAALAALALGWGHGGAVVAGLSVITASTVVMLRGLEARDRLDSPEGRIAIGWSVAEDILTVFALVILPVVAPAIMQTAGGIISDGLWPALLVSLAKIVAFVALMVFVGRRLVPWLLEQVARLGSRELFTLAVLAVALGVGTLASRLFGVSFALGAFLAGVVISESELSHRAAADALPMRDAFAVLFFVSVGMLFDPTIVLRRPVEIAVMAAIVVLWKSGVMTMLLRLLGEPIRGALLIGSAAGQVAEFTFIVAALGVSLGLVDREIQAVIIAASLISITVNTPFVTLAVRLGDRLSAGVTPPAEPRAGSRVEDMRDHVVLVGYGRVGSTVAAALQRAGAAYVVVEEIERVVAGLRLQGARAVLGDATRREVLDRAGISRAKLLVVTAPEPIRARRIVEVAREARPALDVAVRTHSAAEQEFFEATLEAGGARGRAVYAEREAALGLAHYALQSIGRSDDQADVVVDAIREVPPPPPDSLLMGEVPDSGMPRRRSTD